MVGGKEKGMRQLGKFGYINVHERIILKWTVVVVYWILVDRNRLK